MLRKFPPIQYFPDIITIILTTSHYTHCLTKLSDFYQSQATYVYVNITKSLTDMTVLYICLVVNPTCDYSTTVMGTLVRFCYVCEFMHRIYGSCYSIKSFVQFFVYCESRNISSLVCHNDIGIQIVQDGTLVNFLSGEFMY